MGTEDYTPLDVEGIQSSLSTYPVGHRIIYLPEVPSTMDTARQEAAGGATEGVVIVAEEQTAGRGRFGRRWLSAPGTNLSFSVLLYPLKWSSARLSMAASVAVVRGIRQVCGLSPTLKWPNDVLLGDRKVSGILVETAVQNGEVLHAVVGIGINVNSHPEGDAFEGLRATSLADALGSLVSREELLQAVLVELGFIYLSLNGWAEAKDEWQLALETLGRHVRVQWGEQVDEGTAEGVDSEGNLLLQRADGTIITLTAGEVTLQA